MRFSKKNIQPASIRNLYLARNQYITSNHITSSHPCHPPFKPSPLEAFPLVHSSCTTERALLSSASSGRGLQPTIRWPKTTRTARSIAWEVSCKMSRTWQHLEHVNILRYIYLRYILRYGNSERISHIIRLIRSDSSQSSHVTLHQLDSEFKGFSTTGVEKTHRYLRYASAAAS